jgi:hypothetical protein
MKKVEINKSLTTNLRKLSQTSYGIVIPKKLLFENNIDKNAIVILPKMIFFLNIDDPKMEKPEPEIKTYRCRSCGSLFDFNNNEEPYCSVCDEDNMEEVNEF